MAGFLTATMAVGTTADAPFLSTGQLSAEQYARLAQLVSLAATGTLDASARAQFTQLAALAGSGVMTALLSQKYALTGLLTGDGALSGSATGVIPAVSYDATGGGNTGTGSVLSWTHTASGSGRAVIVGASASKVSGTMLVSTITYGGVAMTLLGTRPFNNTGTLTMTALYILLDPPTGAQTVTVTLNSSAINGSSANSVSYTGVGSYGTPVLNSGNSASPAVSVSSAANHRAVAVLGSSVAKSAFTQTERYNGASSNGRAQIGDAAGAATVNFSATQASGSWSAVGVDLIPG